MRVSSWPLAKVTKFPSAGFAFRMERSRKSLAMIALPSFPPTILRFLAAPARTRAWSTSSRASNQTRKGTPKMGATFSAFALPPLNQSLMKRNFRCFRPWISFPSFFLLAVPGGAFSPPCSSFSIALSLLIRSCTDLLSSPSWVSSSGGAFPPLVKPALALRRQSTPS